MFRIGVAELSVILFFAIPICAIVGGIFLASLKVMKGSSSRADQASRAEESRLIQEIYHGLLKMEERVEALETLITDKKRRGGE